MRSDTPIMMLVHGLILAVLVYVVLRYGMGQSEMKSQTRAVFFGLLVALYMVVFGHGMPSRVNYNLM